MGKEQIAIRLDRLDEIDALAAKERRNRSDMIRILIDESLDARAADDARNRKVQP
jgi:metal-responsive CopG/Arc/MetJ family transcriptional regulator